MGILRDTGITLDGAPIGLENGGFASSQVVRAAGAADRILLDVFDSNGAVLRDNQVVVIARADRTVVDHGIVALKDGSVGVWYVQRNPTTNTDTLVFKRVEPDGTLGEALVAATAGTTPERYYTGVSAAVLENGDVVFAVNRYNGDLNDMTVFRTQVRADGSEVVVLDTVEGSIGGWDGAASVIGLADGGYVIASSFIEFIDTFAQGSFGSLEEPGGIFGITDAFNVFDADGMYLTTSENGLFYIADSEFSGFTSTAFDLVSNPGFGLSALADGSFVAPFTQNDLFANRTRFDDPVVINQLVGYALHDGTTGGRGISLPLVPLSQRFQPDDFRGFVLPVDADTGSYIALRDFYNQRTQTVQLFETPAGGATREYAVPASDAIAFFTGATALPDGRIMVSGWNSSFTAQTSKVFDIFGLVLEPGRLEENAAAGTVVGTFEAIGGLADQAVGFSLAGEDAARFVLGAGNVLSVAAGAGFDHEADDTASIVVNVALAGGGVEAVAFDIPVLDVNEAPTALTLSRSAFLIDVARDNEFTAGQGLATFTTEDPDETNLPTYTLTLNPENIFAIVGDQLVVADADRLSKLLGPNSFTIVARSTDEGGLHAERSFRLDFVVDGKPIAVADRYEYDRDTPVGPKTIDVLSNDIVLTGSKDPASLVITVQPEYGSATIVDGSIVYTPGSQGFRPATISYTFEDTADQVSNAGTLRIAPRGKVPEPFIVEGVEFTDVPNTGYAEATGTFTIGRSDGFQRMLQVQNGTIRAYEDRLEIIGGTTFGIIGQAVEPQFATRPIFAGDFTLLSSTGGGSVDDTLERSFEDYSFYLMEVAPNTVRLTQSEVILSGEFTLPDAYGALTLPGTPLEGISISATGVELVGGKLTIPDAKKITLPFTNLDLATKGVALTSITAERALKFEGTLTLSDSFFTQFLKPDLDAHPLIDARDRTGFTQLVIDFGNANAPNGNFLKLTEDPVLGSVLTGSGAIAFPEIKLGGGFAIKDLTASLALLGENDLTIGGGLKVALPFGRLGGSLLEPAYIGGSIKVIVEPLLALDEISLSSEVRIPIPQVPLLDLTLVEMSAKGLSDGPPTNPSEAPFVLEGKLGFEYGGAYAFTTINDWLGFDSGTEIKGSLLAMEVAGTAQVSRTTGAFSLDGSAQLSLISPKLLSATISNVPGKPLVDFYNGAIDALGSFNLGSLFSGTGRLKADLIEARGDGGGSGSANTLYMAASGSGTLSLPSASALGPLSGGGGDATFFAIVTFDDDLRNDYIAVSTTVTIGNGKTQLGGFQLSLDGTVDVFTGGRDLPTVGSWAVEEGLEYITMTAAWENAASSPVELLVTYKEVVGGPVLATYRVADFAANDIAVVDDLTNAFASTVAVFTPRAGVWDVEVVDPAGLGAITYSGSTAALPIDVDWAEVTRNGGADASVFIRAVVEGAADGARIDIFADTDTEGFDGTLVASDLSLAEAASGFTWSLADAPAGDLFLYAIIRDDVSGYQATPYRAEAIQGADEADLSVIFVPDAAADPQSANVAHTIRVANEGADTAHGVVVTVQMPTAQFEIVSLPAGMATPTQTGQALQFLLASLAAGGGFDIVLRTFGEGGGPAADPVSVTVESTSVDPDLANNLAIVASAALPILANDDAASGDEDGAIIGAILANDSGGEGTLRASLVAGPANGTLVLNADGSFAYTPDANFAGVDAFRYRATDVSEGSDEATVTLTVNAENDAPVAVDDAVNAASQTPLVIPVATLLGNDTDIDSATLSITGVGGAVNGMVSLAGGNVTFTPNAGFTGAASFTYTVSDGVLTDAGSVTVTVSPAPNTPPVAANDAFAGDEDTVLSGNVLANDSGAQGDPLTAVLLSGPANAASFTLNPNGTFSYTPVANFNGLASFTYRVNDGTVDGNLATATLTVNTANDAPTATDGAITTDEDTEFSGNLLAVLGASDVDGDDLDIIGIGTSLLGGFGLNNETGAFTFTPDPDENGTASVEVILTDGTVDIVRTLLLTVTPVNDAPVAVDDSAATAFKTPLVIPVASLFGNDTDIDSAVLTVAGVGGAVNGTVSLAAGIVTFTPDDGFSGAASFTYTVSDGVLTDTGAVTVSGPGNTAPAVGDDTVTTRPGRVLDIVASDLLANDSDADGDTLSIDLLVDTVNNGTLLITNDGFTYTPNTGFVGQDEFVYRVADGFGGFDEATVTINVVNTAPVAVDETITYHGRSVTFLATSLLANDTDADGDTLSFETIVGPLNGTLVSDGDNLVYTPPTNVFGSETFTYTVTDGFVGFDTGTVTMTLVNVAPDAKDDVVSTAFNTAVLIPTAQVLGNDTDADGDALLVSSTGAAANGNVTLVSGLGVFYQPNSGFVGQDTFTYMVDDGLGGTDTATVSVIVGAAPLPTTAFQISQGGAGTPPGSIPSGPPLSPAQLALIETAPTLINGEPFTRLENEDTWNGFKNAAFVPSEYTPLLGEKMLFANFVDNRIDLSDAVGVNLDAVVLGAKRGLLKTADGDDTATWYFHSNEGTWSNLATIDTGTGNDTILVSSINLTTLDNQLLADNPVPNNGSFWSAGYDGRFSVARVEAGEGDDVITAAGRSSLEAFGGAGNDTITGALGNDLIVGGNDSDVLSGGEGADRFRFDNADGADEILDFSAAQGDKVQLSSGGSYTLAGTSFTYGTTTVTADNGHIWTAADFLFV